MPSDLPQRKARRFLNDHLQSQASFTRQQLQQFAGWKKKKTFDTYWSKQIKPFVVDIGGGQYRVSEAYRPYMPWKRFQRHVTQVRPIAADAYLDRLCDWIGRHFGGYSIYHVDGRFLAGKMLSRDEAAERERGGQRYLVDETTAVTRFIFPCETDEEAEQVRYFFNELFVRTIILLINAEDQIWMVESGTQNRVHVWRIDGEDDDGSYSETEGGEEETDTEEPDLLPEDEWPQGDGCAPMATPMSLT